MAENKKARAHEEPSGFVRFIRKQVEPLSRVFAASPLAQLQLKTAHGSITLVKANAAVDLGRAGPAGELLAPDSPRSAGDSAKLAARYAPRAPAQNGEPGRTYITINSEVVGIFHDASQPPVPGAALSSGEILGYIEALRLRNEVRCPIDSTLVAQVVVDSQPVDFGEALFVVESAQLSPPESITETSSAQQEAPGEAVPAEPPRL